MKKYFIIDELNETSKLIGPFNTQERAQTFKKKHHYFGRIVEREFKKIIDKSNKLWYNNNCQEEESNMNKMVIASDFFGEAKRFIICFRR